MDLPIAWLAFVLRLTVQVNCEVHLSKQDVELLDEHSYPACFTRKYSDFTCFWKSPVGKSFGFFYKTADHAESRCHITQQSTADKILHVCFFPPSDVFVFSPTHIRVVDEDTNLTVYNKILYVEDNCLLNPPSNVTLHLTGKFGKVLVKWSPPPPPRGFTNPMQYELRYTSESLQDTVTLKKGSKCEHTLLPLVPGQPCAVHIRVKTSFSDTGGHWSDWSTPVRVLAPQAAADIELKCHTSDLHQVCCQWNEERYGYANLYYRQTSRNTWGSWKTCGRSNVSASRCVLYGEECTMFQVYLTAPSGLLNRTFYTNVFRMNNSIKTEPPGWLKHDIIGERICLTWLSPLPQISEHLMYQIRYQVQGESKWKFFTVGNHSTSTCLDVQASGRYTIQLQAIPNGLLYSGHWSDWSKPLTTQLTSTTGLLFIACLPFGLLITSLVMFFSFSRYLRKLKQLLWPPVPNLNHVLEHFLKDLDGQHWEPNISIKHCDDELPASVVEIMSEKEAEVMRKPSWTSNCKRFPQHQSPPGSNEEQSWETSREYVTLKSSPVQDVLTFNGNDYVCRLNASVDALEESVRSPPSVGSDTFSAFTTNILNRSYLQAEIGSGNALSGHYTNLEQKALAKNGLN